MEKLLLSFLAGSLTALSPCVLPALPLVVGSALQEHKLGPLAVSLGMILSFTVFGVLLASLGDTLGLDETLLRSIAASLMLGVGLLLLSKRLQEIFARIAAPISSKAEKILQRSALSGLGGQFFIGALLGAVWTPCSGPTLGAAVALASEPGSITTSAAIMLIFGIGASAPLLFVAYGSRSLFMKSRGALSNLAARGKIIFGLILIGIGTMVLTGYDKMLESFVLDKLPEWLIDLAVKY